MSSIDQSVRFVASAGPNNPLGIYDAYKPSRTLVGSGVPSASLGETEWMYIDTGTGIEYLKDNAGVWNPLVNFSAISHEEPLIQNTIEVDTIMGNSTDNIQIDLKTTGTLSIGPAADLAAIQFQSNGVITSDSASGLSSLSLGNGMGVQVILDPATSSLIGSPDMNVTASNNVAITANGGSLSALCATTMDISAPSGLSVATFGSGTFFNDGAGTILKVLPDSLTLNGAADLAINSDNGLALNANGGILYATSTGDLTLQNFAPSNMLLDTGGDMVLQAFGNGLLSAQTGAVTVSGQTTATVIGGSGATLRSQTNNTSITAIAGDIVLNASSTVTNSGGPIRNTNGTAGAPSYSFVSDTNSGVYSYAADTLGFSTGGSARMTVDNTNVVTMAHVLPVSANTYDLGSAGLPWRNIYSNNLLNVISDVRMKKDLEDFDLGLDFVRKLKPQSYRSIEDVFNSEKKVGLLAQDVRDCLNNSGYDSDKYAIVSKGDILGLKYEALIPCLINAVKEMSEEIKELKDKVKFNKNRSNA